MRSLRVATLNIWGRQGPWEARRTVLRRELAALEVDAIGLQEVLRYESTSGADAQDQALELAEGLGFERAYGAALELGHGLSFGNAILSRFPIRDVRVTPLPTAERSEPRALLAATLDAPFGPVPFYTTHLTWRFDEGALRMRQVLAVVAAIDADRAQADRGSYPVVLVGDFNAEPDADEIRFLRGRHTRDGASTYFIDAFGECGQGDGATFCERNDFARACSEPDRRIDYVFVRGRNAGGVGRPRSARLVFDRAAAPVADEPPIFPSDHFGVIAELALAPTTNEQIA